VLVRDLTEKELLHDRLHVGLELRMRFEALARAKLALGPCQGAHARVNDIELARLEQVRAVQPSPYTFSWQMIGTGRLPCTSTSEIREHPAPIANAIKRSFSFPSLLFAVVSCPVHHVRALFGGGPKTEGGGAKNIVD